MLRSVVLLVVAAGIVAGCTSHSGETWIDPVVGQLPDASAAPTED